MSIPLQLQRLFARLQLGTSRAVTTTKLTKSFGWNDAEAFTQHDVQELCRVLFDSLEQAMAGTHQAQLINSLFQGQMRDYVRCLKCNTERARQDAFLDVPLVIKGFGETTAVKSVQEALQKFVAQEKLEGGNQYRCEHCNALCDAVKGLHFVSFPYILMLQLKRFDFDYETMRRIKLNDRVEFPYYLDLNDFVAGAPPATETSAATQEQPATQEQSTQPDATAPTAAAATTIVDEPPKPTKERPYVYELYAVLMHRGNALGGHYYAYIKEFNHGKWYEFNDSSVTEITDADIRRAYGDDPQASTSTSSYYSSWGGAYAYGANAYMLIYRRIEPARNLLSVTQEQLPQQLRDMVAAEEVEKKAKEEKKRIESETFTIRFYRGREGETPKEKKLHKDTTIAKALEVALELYGLDGGVVPEGCARLRLYSENSSVAIDPLTNPAATLEKAGLTAFRCALFLETRKPDKDFAAYNPNDVDLTCSMWRNEHWDRQTVTVDRQCPLSKLREALATAFGLSETPQKLRLLQMRTSIYDQTSYVHLREDSKSILYLGIGEGIKLFAEECDDGLAELPATGFSSPAVDEITRLRNMLTLRVVSDKRSERITVDKRIKLSELKAKLSEMLSLPVEEMQVSRGTITWKYEFKELDLSLDDHRMYDGMDVFVDRGRPTRAGEYVITLHLFELQSEKAKVPQYRRLLDIGLLEEATVDDTCAQISRALAVLPTDPLIIPPEQIRLRDMLSASLFPGKVFRRGFTVKDHLYLYTNKALAIERLPPKEEQKPEPVVERDDTVLYAQQWHPATLEFGPLVEIVVNQYKPFNQIRERLAPLLGEGIDPRRVSLTKPPYAGIELVATADVAELKWDIVSFDAGADVTVFRATIYLRDGDLLLFKDREEKDKELTPEERQKAQKEAEARKASRYSSYSYTPAKEVALKIHAETE